MRRLMFGAAIGTLTIALAGGTAAAIPNDGEDHKFVLDLSESRAIDCDGDGLDDIDFTATGWLQASLVGGDDNRIDGLGLFHVDNVFANADGDTLVFKDRGPDVLYSNGDGSYVALIGRTQAGNIGRLVIDLSTSEVVFQAGTSPFGGDAFDPDLVGYACERLS